ncbi:DUF305 domain-containing protein [Streptomyces sp. NPDC047014]|uniref:DUF305 domain-containing protein n=1 Tax=Streptomyces sp. NPDC047014 TaxID=3155736 RepID=UPI0033D9A704
MALSARPVRGAAAVLAAAALLLTLSGCQDDEGGDRAGGDGRAAVVAPGRPGEQARHLTPEQAAKARPDDSPNAADRSYVRRMIEHHRQALTMSALAPGRAGADPVKRLAERITAGQKPEIGAMEKWQARYPDPAAGGGGHGAGDHGGADHGAENGAGHGTDHGAMPGMATEQQLKELAEARGAAFDQLFLRLMTAHHQGALTMAGEALAGGNNVAVEEMATEVVATQSAEIHRMRAMG